MTEQELFDKVSNHLLKQNKHSMDSDKSCKYRGNGGRMCAIGVLIPDELYHPWMDSGCTLMRITEIIDLREHYELCCRLQDIHDFDGPAEWPAELADLAEEFGLKYEHE